MNVPLKFLEESLRPNRSKCGCLFLNIQIIHPIYGNYGMTFRRYYKPYKTIGGNVSVIRNSFNIY